MLLWLLLLLGSLFGLFWLLTGCEGTLFGLGGGELAFLVVGGSLALLYLFSLAGDYRGRATTAIRHAMLWVGIFTALIVAYAFRAELSDVGHRVSSELLPPGTSLSIGTATTEERAVRLRKHPNGHFVARGLANGAPLEFLVDTGASTVVLTPSDAQRAGIDVSGLVYATPVSTANGMTFAAPVRLRSLTIGSIEMTDVEALVAKPGNLNGSLLGMSFLRRLRSYEFTGDFLTLRG